MPVDHIQESLSVREHIGEPIAAPGGLDSHERLPTTANESAIVPSATVESVAKELLVSKEQTAIPDTLEGMVGPAVRPPSPKVVLRLQWKKTRWRRLCVMNLDPKQSRFFESAAMK